MRSAPLTMPLSPASCRLVISLRKDAKPLKRMYTIRDMADMLHVHEQTLRNWEKSGLLKVSRIGPNRTRVYGEEELALCRRILGFSGQGINLKGIKALIERERRLSLQESGSRRG